MEATLLRDGVYAVRPIGQLGTCGWYPYPWTVTYVRAKSEQDALRKFNDAHGKHNERT